MIWFKNVTMSAKEIEQKEERAKKRLNELEEMLQRINWEVDFVEN